MKNLRACSQSLTISSRADGEMYLATPVFKTVRKAGDMSKAPAMYSKSPRETESGSFPLVAALDEVNALHNLSAAASIGQSYSYTIHTSHLASCWSGDQKN